MKKIFFIWVLTMVSLSIYSQTGDITIGAKGGYMSYYKAPLYGLDLAYHLNDPFEIAFTGVCNPKISWTNDYTPREKTNELSVYSANLDLRLYIINLDVLMTGPALGGQYLIVNNKTDILGDYKVLGFNMGWHIKANVSEHVRINGGWRYTNAKENLGHHFFYAGLAYTFQTR
jgi:hypothetical protein